MFLYLGYRLKQAKDDIISRYKAKYKSGVNLFNVDLSETPGSDLLEEAVKSSSFFSEHKLIICKNTFAKKVASDLISKQISEYNIASSPDITLLITEQLSEKDIVSKNKELFRLLSTKNSVIKNIEPLEGVKLSEWVKNEVGKRGCFINSPAVKKLTEIVGNDSWNLINEIDKLTAYKSGKEIGTSDISMLVSVKTDLSIFDLMDAVGSKNKQKSIELLYKELGSGRDPYYVLTMVTYQFRNLLTVSGLLEKGLSQAEIAKKACIHPFVVKKAIVNLNRFNSKGELISIYGRLLAIDISSKTGDSNLKDSLYKLVA